MTPEEAKQLNEHGMDADWAAEHDCMIPANDFGPECIRLALWEYACKKWLDEYAPGWKDSSPDPNSIDPVYSKHHVHVHPARCFLAPTRLEALRLAVLATEKEE